MPSRAGSSGGSDVRRELIDGVIVETMPPGGKHGAVAVRIAGHLFAHVDVTRLGVVVVETGFILRRNPDTVLGPDVAFVRAERVAAAAGIPDGFWELAPDLVVEVVSHDRLRTSADHGELVEPRAKVRNWIEAGTRLVWVPYPESRTVEVVGSLLDRRVLTAEDVIDGADVLPGFSCPVHELFG